MYNFILNYTIMSVSLADDFRRRFPTATPAPKKEEIVTPPIDIVTSSVKTQSTKEPSPVAWEANLDTAVGITVKPPTGTRQSRPPREPITVGNRKFYSEATANWSTIRTALYPVYKEFCEANNAKALIYEFNSLVGPRWKALSAEDKVKAVANPSEYFTF